MSRTSRRLRAMAREAAILASGGNATAAVLAERPHLKRTSAHVEGSRWYRSIRGLETEDWRAVLGSHLSDEDVYGRLADLVRQDKSPSVALRAIQHVDRLLGRDVQRVDSRHVSMRLTREALIRGKGFPAPPGLIGPGDVDEGGER